MGNDLLYGQIIAKLLDIHTIYPDLRFGQVVQCALDHMKRGNNININNISSKQILKSLVEYEELTTKKRGGKK